jgi:type IV secretory pathway ATPase VirB11/archaellum biosynthesis ATPase
MLNVVRALNKNEFSLQDVYAFAPHLEKLHPDNRHVLDKIRQSASRRTGIARLGLRGIPRPRALPQLVGPNGIRPRPSAARPSSSASAPLVPRGETQMPEQKRKLILITGIPGTGKTTFGNFLANKYGFVHFDIEQPILHERLWRFPASTIDDILVLLC